MKKLKTILVDDDAMSRKALSKVCTQIDKIDLLTECENGITALKFIKENEVDLILLDIEMPGLSGIDIISSIDYLPSIIFTTTSKAYAVEAFEYDAKDYIIKPVKAERLKKALNKLNVDQIKNEEQKESFFIKVNSKLIKINYTDVTYIEASGDFLIVFTENKEYFTYQKMKNLEELLPENNFFRCHRSYIINTSKITQIEDHRVVLNEKNIPVSRQKWKVLLDRINRI